MSDRDDLGRFAPGNRFWEARSSAGPKPKFETSEALWQSCCEYFEWVDENPLYEDKVTSFQGVNTHEPIAKMRAMTMRGLWLFLDVSAEAWSGWKSEAHHLYRPDLVEVISRAETVVYEQKFTGAAADLLNANIIARDLGLADKVEQSGGLSLTVSTDDANL